MTVYGDDLQNIVCYAVQLQAKGADIARVAERVAEIFGMHLDEVWASAKQAKTVRA